MDDVDELNACAMPCATGFCGHAPQRNAEGLRTPLHTEHDGTQSAEQGDGGCLSGVYQSTLADCRAP
eukprot:4868214-Amphidinium_carterae.2